MEWKIRVRVLGNRCLVSTTGTSGLAVLHWLVAEAACCLVRLTGSGDVGAGAGVDRGLIKRTRWIMWYQPESSLFCSKERPSGADLGAGGRVEMPTFRLPYPHLQHLICCFAVTPDVWASPYVTRLFA